MHFKYKERNRIKSERLEKLYHANTNHKKTNNSVKNRQRIGYLKKITYTNNQQVYEKFSTSPIFREMPIKIIMGCYYMPSKWLK